MKGSANVISFLNMKGGVCKTTLCKEMALFLSENKNRDVLVIDIDPQSNCTQSFFERYNVLEVDEGELITCESSLPSIENIFSKSRGGLNEIKIEDVIYKLSDKLHLIPGDLKTVFMERETGTGASEQKLLNFIDQFKLQDKYDYIFIDCPPTYSFYTVSALLCSNYYLVPLKSDAYSLLGLDLLERVVSELRSLYRANFNVKPINNLGVIFTMIPKNPSKGVQRNVKQIKGTFEDKDIYFFNTEFPKVDRISTGKLSTFIIDREDLGLIEKLSNICEEFEERMAMLNG
ncbi:ParA family protein [Clostridium cadaveris]